MVGSDTQQRLRITFEKKDTMRFVGHLDLAKTWERVLRRANVPLVYSQGFNPQPKIQFAAALPLGISSEDERLDVWLQMRVTPGEVAGRLNAVSPPGLVVRHVEEVPPQSPALQTQVSSAEYRITVEEDEITDRDLERRLVHLLAQEYVERERRGKVYDLRPLILDLRLEGQNRFRAHLTLGDRGTARPDELLAALGLTPNRARCHRLALHLQDDAPPEPE